MKPQCQQILNWLKEKGSLTPAEAYQELGIYRLSGRIKDLRDAHYDIRTELTTYKTDTGKVKRFATYFLADEEV